MSDDPVRRKIGPPRWLPNAITGLRIALVPVFLWLATEGGRAVQSGGSGTLDRSLAGLTLIVIGLSDVLDGYLARRHHLVSTLGSVLDAVADKLVQVSALGFFWWMGPPYVRIPLWFLSLILLRDVVLAAGSLIIRRRHGSVQVIHQPHGKIASLLLFGVLLAITFGVALRAIPLLLWIIAGVVVLSTLDYVNEGWRQFRRTPRSASA